MEFREQLRNFARNELLRASLILLILINVANVLNYLFHFTMAVMLGPADYGILAVLTNIIYIFSVPSSSIQTVVSKYATRLGAKKEFGKIRGIFNYLIKEMMLVSLLIFILFLIASVYLSKELHIQFWLLALTGLFLFGSFICPIGMGILQGMKKFGAFGWNAILNSIVKLILAIILVLMGFRVYGPIIGFVVAMAVSFAFIFPFIKEITSSREIKEKIRIFYGENLAAVIAILFMTLMYTADTIVAKFMFSPELAGKYAVASMIGKMIFFAALAITNAMFPISSERFVNGNKKNTEFVFNRAALAMGILGLIAVIALAIAPELILRILQLKQYIEISGILAYVGIAFVFLSFLNMILLYRISISELRIRHGLYILALFILEVAALIIFSKTVVSFSLAFMTVSIISFLISLVFIRRRK